MATCISVAVETTATYRQKFQVQSIDMNVATSVLKEAYFIPRAVVLVVVSD